jgi:hypothetical protein
MKPLGEYEVWFLTGSQDLYGEDALRQVADHAARIATGLDDAAAIPVRVVFKPAVKSPRDHLAAPPAEASRATGDGSAGDLDRCSDDPCWSPGRPHPSEGNTGRPPQAAAVAGVPHQGGVRTELIGGRRSGQVLRASTRARHPV